MIKCKNGRVILKGSKALILTEFMSLFMAMSKAFTLAEIDEAFRTFEEIKEAHRKEQADENEAVTDPELS